jgi:Predicted dehydrogenases and related proteins
MERVRVGVVGTGGIFVGAHLPAYPEIPEAQIVALCDVSQAALQRAMKRLTELYERRAQRAEEEGDKERAEQLRRDAKEVKLYTDYNEMIRREKPDLVEICTSPDFHAPVAIAALKAGCHVMCEKPMARTWLECIDVCEVVEETGRFYQHNETGS